MENRGRNTFAQEILDSPFLPMLEQLQEQEPGTKFNEDEENGAILSLMINFLDENSNNPLHSSLARMKNMME